MDTDGRGVDPRPAGDLAQRSAAPDSESRSLLQRITDLLAQYVFHNDRSLIEECKFRVHVRRESQDRLMVLLMAFGTLVFLIWPTDFFLFQASDVIRVFTVWRIGTFLAMGILMGLIYTLNLVRERNYWLLVGYLSVFFGVTGYLFGEVRGLSFPWFYIAYMLPMMSIPVAVDLLPRMLGSTLVTASYVAAYMYNVPGSTQYPDLHQFMPLTASSIFLFTMIGHSIYHLDRVNYFQSQVVQKQRQRVRELARRDQLTGLLNRREFEDRYYDEFQRANRYGKFLSALMADLDHFKEINDTYGHQLGDEVLRRMGEVLQDMTRQVDIVGRYGGEEFVVVLPETDLKNGLRAAERINRELAAQEFAAEEGQTFSVTCSIGVAELASADGDPEGLIKQADGALYRAKESGRDQVVQAPK